MSSISSGTETITPASFSRKLLSTFGETPTDFSFTLGVSAKEPAVEHIGAFGQFSNCQTMLDMISKVGALKLQPTQDLWRSLPPGSEKRSLWNTVVSLVVAKQDERSFLKRCRDTRDHQAAKSYLDAITTTKDGPVEIMIASPDKELTLMSDDEISLMYGEFKTTNES